VGITAHRADSQETVLRILITADRVLLDDPGASLQAVADAAGVDRTTVHRRFTSRASLIRALAERAEAELLAAIEQVAATPPSTAAIARLARLLVVAKTRWAFGIRVVATDPSRPRGAAELCGYLDRCRADGVLTAAVPTSWLVASLLEILRLAADEVRDGSASADEAASLAQQVFLNGYGGAS